MESFFPKGFKPLSLVKFDGCIDPYEHVISINTQMAIIEVPDSLKCKLFSGTLRDAPCNGIWVYFEPLSLVIKNW